MTGDIRQTVDALRERERLFRTLAENVPGAVYLCKNDERYTMLYLNEHVEKLTGYTPDDFLADRISFVDLYHPEDGPSIFAQVDAALAKKQPFHILYRLKTRAGQWRRVEEHGQGVWDERGQLLFLEGTIFDVSEQERLRGELLQAQKMESLGLLAGGIAHDFNNLLTSILGNAQLALMTLPAAAPEREAIARVIEASERAAMLTRQMLAYSGRGSFEVHPLDLSREVESIARLVEPSISKKISLELDVAHETRAVRGDLAQIQQLVMNLVLNAAESIGDRGGKVRVATREVTLDARAAAALRPEGSASPGRHLELTVADDGCGMSDETRAKIFDPFFSTKFAGRGLGLAAVIGIVKGHAGGLEVTSAPARGTVFKIYFPATDEPPWAPAPRVDGELRGAGQTVLVIDDEEAVREFVRRALEHFGYRALVAGGGRAGVELLRAHPEVELCVLDMTMPDLDGAETMRELRHVRPSLRVVLSSGYEEVEATRRMQKMDHAGFLQKPYLPTDLAAIVKAALAKAALAR